MSDLIDRQQAIEAICMETCGVCLKNERCMVHCTEVQTVEKLPPAQPEIVTCDRCVATKRSECIWHNAGATFCSFGEVTT